MAESEIKGKGELEMTEEELRKESTYTVQWECTPMIDRPTFINSYITGAMPREERIVNLEKAIASLLAQIDKMKNCGNCNGMSKGSGLRTAKCMLCIQNAKLSEWELAEN